MPQYKVRVGTVQLADGKVAKAGESVEVSEEEAKAHPDVYESAEEDKRLTPDDGSKPEEVDERTKRVRAEAIRYEAGTLPPPPEQRPTGDDGGAAQTAERLQAETQRADTERQGVLGRLRHRNRGGGGDTGGTGGGGTEGA